MESVELMPCPVCRGEGIIEINSVNNEPYAKCSSHCIFANIRFTIAQWNKLSRATALGCPDEEPRKLAGMVKDAVSAKEQVRKAYKIVEKERDELHEKLKECEEECEELATAWERYCPDAVKERDELRKEILELREGMDIYIKSMRAKSLLVSDLRAELARAQERIEKYKVVARWAEDAADCVDYMNIRQGLLKSLAEVEE